MKTRWKILIGLAAVLGIVVVAAVAHHFQLKAAVNRYRAELKAKGEPMELAEVIPPPVPSQKNGAEIFLKAYGLIQNTTSFLSTNSLCGNRMVGPGRAKVCFMQPYLSEPGKFGFTNSWEQADSARSQYDDAIQLLRQVGDERIPDFQINYAKGFTEAGLFTNLHLVDLKKSATILGDAALIDLHAGNIVGAVQNVCSALALTEALKHQKLVISELVRIAMVSNAQYPTWELMQSEKIPDQDLSKLQNAWERLELIPGLEDALTVERLVGDLTLSKQRTSNAELEKYLGVFQAARRSLGDDEEADVNIFQRAKFRIEIFLWRYWWSYSDELRTLHGMQILEDASRQAETNGAFSALLHEQQADLEKLGLFQGPDKLVNPLLLFEQPDLHSMLSDSVITLSGCLKRVMNIEALRSVTIAAIALKRFQLKHGVYPAHLAELTPEFLASVPLDPVDGKPLRYRLNTDGSFTLYSVGENGKDDGGNPTLADDSRSKSLQWQNPNALDWVWPQPATDAEIQKYYEEQAKQP
jgi:hypothetical protein